MRHLPRRKPRFDECRTRKFSDQCRMAVPCRMDMLTRNTFGDNGGGGLVGARFKSQNDLAGRDGNHAGSVPFHLGGGAGNVPLSRKPCK